MKKISPWTIAEIIILCFLVAIVVVWTSVQILKYETDKTLDACCHSLQRNGRIHILFQR